MPARYSIGDTLPDDQPHIPTLYAAAFPQEDLVFLVESLLDDPAVLRLARPLAAAPAERADRLGLGVEIPAVAHLVARW